MVEEKNMKVGLSTEDVLVNQSGLWINMIATRLR